MKKILSLLLMIILFEMAVKSQEVTRTIRGATDKSITATKIIFDGAAINLKGSKKADEPVIISCDVLQINANVTAIQVHGYVKLVCNQYVNNLLAGTSISVPAASNSSGSLIIEKPSSPSIPDIKFDNDCLDLEIKRADDKE